jgi:hypothetical protein
MSEIAIVDGIVQVDSRPLQLGARAIEAHELGDLILVLFDPDERPGNVGQYRNPRCVRWRQRALDGRPSNEAYGRHVLRRRKRSKPLVALSFTSYRVELDASSGKIVRQHVLK